MSRSLNFAVWFVGLASYSNFAPKIVLDYKKKKKTETGRCRRRHMTTCKFPARRPMEY